MAVKVYKPTSPGRRDMTGYAFEEITRSKPEKSLTVGLKRKGGRNRGKIAVRHRGGGHKRRYRIIDFKRNKFDIPGTVESIEYDPNRTARIALIQYEDGEKRYIIAPLGLQVGNTIMSAKRQVEINPGNTMPLRDIPLGTMVHNIELQPGKGGQMVRSAGTSAQLLAKDHPLYATLRLPSGEQRYVPQECLATIGQVGNTEHGNIKLGKAGRKRHLGIRPTVRGSAMNPNDHPHGGGEGRSPVGMAAPKTPWGKVALGKRTRRNKETDKYIFRRRTKKRR